MSQAATAPAIDAGQGRAPVKLVVANKENTPFVPGRRVFFKYRDLGVADATQGRMRAQVMSAISGMTEPTGWHHHLCDPVHGDPETAEPEVRLRLPGWLLQPASTEAV